MANNRDANIQRRIADIERTIAGLSQQVAALRLEAAPAPRPPQPAAQPSAPVQANPPVARAPQRVPWIPAIGDPVTIFVRGENRDGVIVGFTPKRTKIRVPGEGIVYRSANHVHLSVVIVR
jgi:hypothetical protein